MYEIIVGLVAKMTTTASLVLTLIRQMDEIDLDDISLFLRTFSNSDLYMIKGFFNMSTWLFNPSGRLLEFGLYTMCIHIYKYIWTCRRTCIVVKNHIHIIIIKFKDLIKVIYFVKWSMSSKI